MVTKYHFSVSDIIRRHPLHNRLWNILHWGWYFKSFAVRTLNGRFGSTYNFLNHSWNCFLKHCWTRLQYGSQEFKKKSPTFCYENTYLKEYLSYIIYFLFYEGNIGWSLFDKATDLVKSIHIVNSHLNVLTSCNILNSS